MSGLGTIGVVTTLIALRSVATEGGSAIVKFDTPAGLVTATARIVHKKVQDVTVRGTPSFYHSTVKM